MNDDRKPDQSVPGEPKRREPASIDLPKSEVVDLTPADRTGPEAAGAETPRESAGKPSEAAETPAGKAENADEAAPPPAPPVPPKPGRAGALFAGLVAGGLAGAGAGYGVQAYLPSAATTDPRLPALQSGASAAEKSIVALRGELARVETALKSAEDRATGSARELSEKLAALDSRPPQLPAEAAERLRELAGARTALDGRMKAIDEAVAVARKQAEDAAGKVEAIGKLTAAAPGETKVDLAPLAARIVTLEKVTGEAVQRTAAGDQALSALDNRLRGAEETVSALKSAVPTETGTAVLAVSALARRRIEAGQSLLGLVPAFAGLGVGADDLKPMAVYGDRPAPRLAALADEFAGLGAKLPRATPLPVAPAQETSVLDRLKANVTALVDVRPTGANRPPDTASMLADARARLLAGDAAGFDRALAGLTAEQRATLKPVTDALASRQAVFTALDRIETQALATAARRTAGGRTQ